MCLNVGKIKFIPKESALVLKVTTSSMEIVQNVLKMNTLITRRLNVNLTALLTPTTWEEDATAMMDTTSSTDFAKNVPMEVSITKEPKNVMTSVLVLMKFILPMVVSAETDMIKLTEFVEDVHIEEFITPSLNLVTASLVSNLLEICACHFVLKIKPEKQMEHVTVQKDS